VGIGARSGDKVNPAVNDEDVPGYEGRRVRSEIYRRLPPISAGRAVWRSIAVRRPIDDIILCFERSLEGLGTSIVDDDATRVAFGRSAQARENRMVLLADRAFLRVVGRGSDARRPSPVTSWPERPLDE
jgi:hypothetical protein